MLRFENARNQTRVPQSGHLPPTGPCGNCGRVIQRTALQTIILMTIRPAKETTLVCDVTCMNGYYDRKYGKSSLLMVRSL